MTATVTTAMPMTRTAAITAVATTYKTVTVTMALCCSGLTRKVVRETLKFFTTKAGKKENRLGEQAKNFGLYSSGYDFTAAFTRYVGSRNWIEFENALAVWIAYLPSNIDVFMAQVELDSSGPLTPYTKETLANGHSNQAQVGLRIYAACHREITRPACSYLSDAKYMLNTAGFWCALDKQLGIWIEDPDSFLNGTKPIQHDGMTTAMHKYACFTGGTVPKCRTCRKKKGDCGCCARKECRVHKEDDHITQIRQPWAGSTAVTAITAIALKAARKCLKGHKGEMLTGGTLHPDNLSPLKKEIYGYARADDDVCESLLGLLGDTLVGRPRMDHIRVEGFLKFAKMDAAMHLDSMPAEKRDKILTLGRRHAKEKRKMPGNRTMEEYSRKLYNEVSLIRL